MYQVIIVEDEPYIRQSLERRIDWASLGCRVAAAVGSADEALQELQARDVDILLTDIRMDGMDGLQLAEEVRVRFPIVRIIFLTGHSEFAYAQCAVKLHAEDFILKPTDPAELRRAVLRAVDAIGVERSREHTLSGLRETVTRNLPALREKLIMDLAHGHSPLDEEMSERLAFLELPLREYILVLMEVAEQEGAGTPRDELGRQMVFTALKERSLIPGDGHVPLLIVEIEQSRFLLVANETTDGALEVIQEHVDRLFGATVSMGVSTHIPDWRGFHRGYEQAEEALRHRFYLGGGAIVRYQDLGAPGAAASSDLESSIDIGRLVEYVRAGDLEMTRHELETLERSLGAGTDRGIVRARSIALEIQVLTQRALAEQGLDGGSGIDECLECVSACQTLAELLEQLAVSVTAAAGAIHDRICIAGRTIVDRVTGYLAEHYHRPIRLEDLAREVSKHPKYLCRLIKRETGATFSELLLAVRMDRARELLRDPANNVAEVAFQVGMDDPHYFSKVFKKHYGATPSDYRHQFVTRN